MHKKTNIIRYVITCLVATGFLLAISETLAAEIKIGLRAHSGLEKTLHKWQPTADYLNQAIPEHHFSFVPFELNMALNQAVSRNEFDFILTNSAT